MRYYIASANEYLVVTGAGIPDLRICKKALVYPWQKVRTILATLEAYGSEKIISDIKALDVADLSHAV